MAHRLYLTPLSGSGTKLDPRRPKYAADAESRDIPWAMMDFGAEPLCLFSADIPDDLHAQFAAQPDVLALPLNLDQAIGAQLTTVQNALESRNIPAQWILDTHTYRQVIRIVAQLCQFLQRLNGLTASRLFKSGITLDTRFNQLSVTMRQLLVDAATSFNYNTSSLSGTSTLRNILKTMADQWSQIEMFIGGRAL